MSSSIQMDANGRLVLPKALRERLNLTRGARLWVEMVAGRIELTPVENVGAAALTRKAGITVLKSTGAKVDAAAAIAAERASQKERGRRISILPCSSRRSSRTKPATKRALICGKKEILWSGRML